jgi:hypothetical protein
MVESASSARKVTRSGLAKIEAGTCYHYALFEPYSEATLLKTLRPSSQLGTDTIARALETVVVK